MSIAVSLDELRDELAEWGVAALATVGDRDGRPFVKLVTLVPEWDGHGRSARLACRHTGRTTIANVAERDAVALYFPSHRSSSGYSLIVDGRGVVAPDLDGIWVEGLSAVRHRPAPPAGPDGVRT